MLKCPDCVVTLFRGDNATYLCESCGKQFVLRVKEPDRPPHERDQLRRFGDFVRGLGHTEH